MLLSLHIENMAVIRRLDVDLEGGLTAITGETGAGKSVMIDSLRFLMGAKADKELIRHGEESALVSAVFTSLADSVKDALQALDVSTDEEGVLDVSRRLSADGKSVSRINGRTVSLAVLKDVMQLLLHIHAQDDTTFFKREGSELSVLDSAAHNANELSAYRSRYKTLLELRRKIARLSGKVKEKNRTIETLRYQIGEIEEVSPTEGEEDRLFDEKLKLRSLERITKQTTFAYRALRGAEKGNACYILDRASASLRQITDIVPEAEELASIIDECYSTVEDVAERARGLASICSEDPTEALDRVEDRLAAIARLKRKYGSSETEILSFLATSKTRLAELEALDEDIARYKGEYDEAYRLTLLAADLLHETRQRAAKELKAETDALLHALDMPNALFSVEFEKQRECEEYIFTENGYETVTFMVAINKGEPAVSVAKCASGGEMSRIMLALKTVIARHDGMPTVIFDEIDSGVSGKTSRKIGHSLKASSRETQILCITHSAQIASLADRHLLVFKEVLDGRTESAAMFLDKGARIEELSRILGGIHVTDAQRQAARDMLLNQEI